MVFYNDEYEIIGIEGDSLDLFGVKNAKEIISTNMDISDFFVEKEGYIYKYDFCHWLDFILFSDNKDHKVLISNDIIGTREYAIKIREIYSFVKVGDENIVYGVDFIKAKESSSKNKDEYVQIDELDMDKELYFELLEDFFNENERYFQSLKNYLIDRKVDKALKVVRSVKSIAQNLKLKNLIPVLNNIEEELGVANYKGAYDFLENYSREIEALKSVKIV